MKKRRERTREEKKRLAEVMFGKNYKNLSSMWDCRTPAINWVALDEELKKIKKSR